MNYIENASSTNLCQLWKLPKTRELTLLLKLEEFGSSSTGWCTFGDRVQIGVANTRSGRIVPRNPGYRKIAIHL